MSLWIIVSSAVSHLVSTSGVCLVKFRRRAFKSMSINFCSHTAGCCCWLCCYGLHVGYQCLALEPDAPLAYVAMSS